MADDGKTGDDIGKMKTDLTAAQDRAKGLEAELTDVKKSLEGWSGLDSASVKGKLEDYELLKQDAAKKTPEDLTKYKDGVKAEVATQFKDSITKLRDENKKLKGDNHELRVVDKAMSEIGGLFNDDMRGFIKQHVAGVVDVNDQGQFIVKNEAGETRYNNAAGLFSIQDLGVELKEKFPSAAKSQVTSGGKQTGQITNGTTSTGLDLSAYAKASPTERARMSQKDRGELAVKLLTQVPIGNSS